MMLWHFPGQYLSAYGFLSPFLFLLLSLPFCAALALFFESVRFLRGSFGSIIFVIAFFSVYVVVSMVEEPSFLLRSFDFSGTSFIYQGINRAALEQSGAPLDVLLFLGSAAEGLPTPTMHLVFNGISVSTADIQGFAGMLCVTLGLAVLSAPLYSLSNKLSVVKLPKKDAKKGMATTVGREAATSYAPVSPSAKNMWIRGIFSELSLMLSGQPFIWKLISLGAMIACLFMDLGMVQIYILPLALLWFINVYSAMGSREHQHDVLKYISTIPNGLLRQIIFSWASGIIISLTLSFPVILRMLFLGQTVGVFACLAGVVFLPSLALFLGEFTKTQRVFELSFIVITYVILNNVTAFMYIGIHPDIVSLSRSFIYLFAGLVMGVAAVLKRTGNAV